jgi:excisionase family DNA binding protein
VTNLATPAEVAEYLNISPETLRQWAYRKQGPPYIMVEGARRYDRDDLQAYIEARKVRH